MKRHSIPAEIAKQVIERDKATCQSCGKVGVPVKRYGKYCVVENPLDLPITPWQLYNRNDVIAFEIHHKTAVCLNGTNLKDNLTLLCRKCNRSLRWHEQVKKYLSSQS